jgi:hypothetical protein
MFLCNYSLFADTHPKWQKDRTTHYMLNPQSLISTIITHTKLKLNTPTARLIYASEL